MSYTTTNLKLSQIEGSSNGTPFRLSYCGEVSLQTLVYFTSYLSTGVSSTSPSIKHYSLNPSSVLNLKCMTLGHSSDLATIYSGVAVETSSGVWSFAMLTLTVSSGAYSYKIVSNSPVTSITTNNIRRGGTYGSDGYHRFVGTTTNSGSKGFILSFDDSKNFAGQADTTYGTTVTGTMTTTTVSSFDSPSKKFGEVGNSYDILKYTSYIDQYSLNALVSVF